MAAPNRVDELRKRYHEHPRRYFAPLANEYRKTGFVDRAILLCEKHLGEQPDNMNGLVVYGQCLFETGRHADARAPFEAALALDPENLIALRHLGDIAKLGGDAVGARAWYKKVLELDRRNDEVQALLAEVGGAEAPAARPSAGTASAARPASAVEDIGMVALDFPEPAAPPPPPVPVTGRPTRVPTPVDHAARTIEVSSSERPPKRASLLDVSFDFGEGTPVEAPTASARPPQAPAPGSLRERPAEPAALAGLPMVEGLEAAEFSADVAPLSDLEPMEFQTAESTPLAGLESAEFIGTTADASPLEGLESQEFTVPAHDVALGTTGSSGQSEPSVDLPWLPSLEEAETVEVTADQVRSMVGGGSAGGGPAIPVVEQDAYLEPVDPAAAAPEFVTETMATLYLQQGFKDRAIDVYRRLIEQSPDDAGLRERLRAIEAPARGSLEFLTPADEDLPPEPAPPPNAMLSSVSFAEVSLRTPVGPGGQAGSTPVSAAVVATGPSAREFFAAFARRGLAPASGSATAAVPERGGEPDVTGSGGGWNSLDELFGSSVTEHDDTAARYLAVVGAREEPSGAGSLDALFASGGAGVAVAADPAAAAPMAPAGEPHGDLPMPGEDDLDQFQGWLRGLAQ